MKHPIVRTFLLAIAFAGGFSLQRGLHVPAIDAQNRAQAPIFEVDPFWPKPLPNHGGAFKCTFCYDRQKSGLTPACAKVCPTESIVFGRLDDLRARASERVRYLRENGYSDAQLYDPQDTSVGSIHAFFLLLGDPEPYGLPPKPEIPTIYLKAAWTAAFATAIGAIATVAIAFFV